MKTFYTIITIAILSASLSAQGRADSATASAKNADTTEVAIETKADSLEHRQKLPASLYGVKLDDGPVEVYNLCGQFVTNDLRKLKKGVYVVKQNGASRKMVVR